MTLAVPFTVNGSRQPVIHEVYDRLRSKRFRPQPFDLRVNALVIAGTGLGNIVEQTPLITAVAMLYANVDVLLPLTHASLAGILQDMPGVRHVYSDEAGFVAIREQRRIYDAVFATYLVCDYALRVPTSAIYVGSSFLADGTETALCMTAAYEAGYTGTTPPTWCSAEEWPRRLPDVPLIGFTPGGKPTQRWRLKRYPYYAEVIAGVAAVRPDVRFLQLGTRTDDELRHFAVIDFRGRTTVSQAAWLAHKCQVYVANDCGMSHVAAACGVPTVVLFGPTNVRKNLPLQNAVCLKHAGLRCQPCQRPFNHIGRLPNGKLCKHRCMVDIPASRVIEAILAHLPANGSI